MTNRFLSPITASALNGPVETTIIDLLADYGLDRSEGLLGSIAELSSHLSFFQIACDPKIGIGNLDDIRVLCRQATTSASAAIKVIEKGESWDVEFKSSLAFDIRKFQNAPNLPLSEYKSDAVIHSSLKTIAAFCNCGGGDLFIGVEDDGNIYGMEYDFSVTSPSRKDFDGWDQYLRGQIESRFYDGKAVSSYVKASPLDLHGKMFVHLKVGKRSNLTFLKSVNSGPELYVRSGTRSMKIEYQDIEKHFRIERLF